MSRALLSAILIPLTMGCVTTAPNQQPAPRLESTQVDLVVKDIDAEMLHGLQAELLKVPELRSAQLNGHTGRVATFSVMYAGPVSDLPKSLARIPHPGLRYGAAVHTYEYAAFDNQPPTIAFLFPHAEQVLNIKDQFVTVEVPDKDIASITIGGKAAPLYRGNVYRLKVTLVEGPQELVAAAKDKSGNETTVRVPIVVDTTAPALQAQIKLLVEGTVEPGSSVLIDGLEVPVDSGGNYRAEVPVRKGQRKVEIVAIDASGNKSVTTRTLGE